MSLILLKAKNMCGIFGIYEHKEASRITYLGLSSLQHRGQESVGIASYDGNNLKVIRKNDLVSDAFDSTILAELSGQTTIGHVRYSTSGGTYFQNAQPLRISYQYGDLAVAHNGNFLYAEQWRAELKNEGAIFQTETDTEILVHLIAHSKKKHFKDKVIESLLKLKGAYSLLILDKSGIMAVRDPLGYRPLVMGKLDNSIVFSSEDCAFNLLGIELIREVKPGEVVYVTKTGIESFFPFETQRKAFCVFEHIYFSRPDSTVFGENVYASRLKMGKILAREAPAKADIVIPVPDSGVASSIGYSQESGIPFSLGLTRTYYVGRTFIEPDKHIRSFGVKLKLKPISSVLKGKKVVVVDDSLVRGTTARKIIEMIRNAGAKEVHLRVASPPVKYPCYYGIDISTKKELIASNLNHDEIADYINVDSLEYLSIKGMLSVLKDSGENYCTACFDGNYPQSPNLK